MSRFRGRRESKAPMMLTANVRLAAAVDNNDDHENESPESEEALLNPSSEPSSSEPDSRAESTGIHDTTVVNHRGAIVGEPSTDESIRSGGNTTDVDMADASPIAKFANAVVCPKTLTAVAMVPTDAGSVFKEVFVPRVASKPAEVVSVKKDSNLSNDSGKDDDGEEDDNDTVEGFYSSVSIIEEQVKGNFPITARPPGLVDCGIVSSTDFLSIDATALLTVFELVF